MKFGWWLFAAGATVIGFLVLKARREGRGEAGAGEVSIRSTGEGRIESSRAMVEPLRTASMAAAASAVVQKKRTWSTATGDTWSQLMRPEKWALVEPLLKARGVEYEVTTKRLREPSPYLAAPSDVNVVTVDSGAGRRTLINIMGSLFEAFTQIDREAMKKARAYYLANPPAATGGDIVAQPTQATRAL